MNTNKKYTRKQILESIKYWKNQLKEGNFKKLNESFIIQYDDPNNDKHKTFGPFNTENDAYEFAKYEFFNTINPNGWYGEGGEELVWAYQDDDPSIKSVEDVAKKDFDQFKKNKKFTWTDGYYDFDKITLKRV